LTSKAAARDRFVAHLTDAVTAVEAGKSADAVEHLLEAWRELPLPRLADAIERLAERGTAETFPGKTAKARHEAWLATASLHRASDVPRLVSTLLDGAKSPVAAERLDAISSLPADPRIARTLAGIAARPPFQAGTTKPFWKKLYPLLVTHADPRTLATLEPLSEKYVELVGAATMGSYMKTQLDLALTALRKRFGDDGPASTPAQAAALDRLDASAPPPSPETAAAIARTADDFLRAIAEQPDDDAPRLVYADWLQEQGDPRGEFIALQFRRLREGSLPEKDEAREAALLSKHRRDWLGPLYRVLQTQWAECRFTRGFLSVARLCPNTALADAVTATTVWSTVEDLFVAPRPFSYAKLFESPTFGALRSLRAASDDVVTTLLQSGAAPKLESLECLRLRRADAEALQRFGALRALAVHALEGKWMDPAENAWLLALPVVERLSSLTVFVDLTAPTALLPELLSQLLRDRRVPELHLDLRFGIMAFGAIHAPLAEDGVHRSSLVFDLTGVHPSYQHTERNAQTSSVTRFLAAVEAAAPAVERIRLVGATGEARTAMAAGASRLSVALE
jgi:uncharacterized protein (TIGR02996 family)